MEVNSKRDLKLAWRIYELMCAINDIDNTQYDWDEQKPILIMISDYNLYKSKYKSGHSYGEKK